MNRIFRSKSIDRIASPEQLNDYVRVSNPGVWMALVAIMVLLIGVCVWGVFGTMDTTVQTAAVVKEGRAVCYVKEKDIESIRVGQAVQIKDFACVVEEVAASPVTVSADTDAYVLHLGSLSAGEWVFAVTCTTSLPDGVYEGRIVTESIHPLSFLLN